VWRAATLAAVLISVAFFTLFNGNPLGLPQAWRSGCTFRAVLFGSCGGRSRSVARLAAFASGGIRWTTALPAMLQLEPPW